MAIVSYYPAEGGLTAYGGAKLYYAELLVDSRKLHSNNKLSLHESIFGDTSNV